MLSEIDPPGKFASYHTKSDAKRDRSSWLYAVNQKGVVVDCDPDKGDMIGYSSYVLENTGNRTSVARNKPTFSLQRRFYNHPKSFESAPAPKYNTGKSFVTTKQAWSFGRPKTGESQLRNPRLESRDSFVFGYINPNGFLSPAPLRPEDQDVGPAKYRSEEAALVVKPRTVASRWGSSHTHRFEETEIQKQRVPGPGTYQPNDYHHMGDKQGFAYGPKPVGGRLARSKSAGVLRSGARRQSEDIKEGDQKKKEADKAEADREAPVIKKKGPKKERRKKVECTVHLCHARH